MIKLISSPSNEDVKHINLLRSKSRFRKDNQQFVVEGRREFERALINGFKLEKKYRDPSLLGDGDPWLENFWNKGPDETLLTSKVYEKLTVRGGTEGVIGVFQEKQFDLEGLKADKSPLYVVLDGIEKPGNIGAIFRTADAAGVSGILLSNFSGDVFNPNSIRASVGCVFSIPFVISSPSEILDFLEKGCISPFLALPGDHPSVFDMNLSGPSALVFGAEDQGVSKEYQKDDLGAFNIPMAGIADSLNVSVSVGITLYEAVRQRSAL